VAYLGVARYVGGGDFRLAVGQLAGEHLVVHPPTRWLQTGYMRVQAGCTRLQAGEHLVGHPLFHMPRHLSHSSSTSRYSPGSTLRANMPDCLKAFSRPSVALSTIGPPWNCGPTEAQYLFASPCDCGHSMKRRCTGMSVRRKGELMAIVCSIASSGSSVCSSERTTDWAKG
jgi:hypothetical protein